MDWQLVKEDLADVLKRRARALAAPLSPAHRRWRRFLGGFSFDPESAARPLNPPTRADFILCGAPRSGTTLAAAMLFQPPRVVTVMEPWDGLRSPPAELFASLRAEIAETGRLRRGKLDVEALTTQGAVKWWAEGTPTPGLTLARDYQLGVKWPCFWRYLELLHGPRFLVCLRHPFEVIASYKRQPGRLHDGLEYDVAFNHALNRELRTKTPWPTLRRIELYETIHRRLLPHLARPDVFVIRYERWHTEPEKLLGEIAAFLGIEGGLEPLPIHESGGRSGLSAYEQGLIRERCTTARALGYGLG